MIRELRAVTEPGRRLVELAETISDDLATRAAEHDEVGDYPHEAVEMLKDKGFLWAPIPEGLGGGGVRSAHDLLVAASRIGRGDPSVAIGVNMHLVLIDNLTRNHERAVAAGDPSSSRVAGVIRAIVDGGVVIAAAASERDQDLARPATSARRTADGWVVNGHKIFCTMSPAADLLSVAVTVPAADTRSGVEEYSFAMVPATAPGVTNHGDWDSLGMRASGSHSVSFADVHLPAGSINGGFPTATASRELLDRYLLSGPFHASATLGIAESAHERALATVRRRYESGPVAGRAEGLVGENAVAVAAMRTMLAAAGRAIDDYRDAHPLGDAPDREAMTVYADVQSAKAFIDRTAVAVVDRALELAGGAGYLRRHPLARAYRDVRAGAFMHPLGANRAWDYVAQVALGREPSIN